MEVTMTKDKVTKNAIRFTSGRDPNNPDDPHTKNIYLLKSEVEELGNPDVIKVTITKVS
jgi:hypothetical protein